jgi:endonuclease G
MNDGEWRHVEEAVHKWSRTAKRLIVLTGPIFSNDMERIGKHDDIAVPKSFFKVIYSPEQNRAIAFVMENKKMPNSWTNYATTIDKVEALTGYDFLASLDDEVENVVESKENIKDWPAYYPRR